MPQFSCKVKDSTGKTSQEILEAPDKRSAAAILRERGLFPIEISSAGPSPGSAKSSTSLFTGINIGMLSVCFTQIAAMLKAGMSLSEVLTSQVSRTKGKLGSILQEALDAVRSGRPFSEVLARYPSVFNTLIVSLIRSGEKGGMLDSMVDMVAKNLLFEIRIRRAFSKVLFYPYVILFFVIITPHVPVLFLKDTGAFFQSLLGSVKYWLPALIVMFVLIKLLMQNYWARRAWDGFKILPPIIGTAAAKLAYARFARAMAALYQAGMPMDESLRIAADASGNLEIARRLKPAAAAVASGKSLAESVASTGALSPIVVDMLSVGERTGNYEMLLEKVADNLEEDVDTSFTKASIILMVLCLLIAALIVGFMAIKFYVGAATGVMNEGDL